MVNLCDIKNTNTGLKGTWPFFAPLANPCSHFGFWRPYYY